MVNPLVIGAFFSGLAGAISKYKEGKQSAEADRYRVSLAEENARRADILHAERSERLRKEGLLDAGLFQMKVEMSGLSGVSADMWIGQRFADTEREVEKAQSTRSSTVQRFLKEQQWLKQNATNSKVSGIVSSAGHGLTLAKDLFKDK
ncbi:hypothetical protein GS16_00325 [Candidatus Liberibacter solanacearum]|uniref:hypothetical protein n=1 Tax=Candidatus Liberibacter solanacearum TaxID=556287 RepID=UPI00050764A5|nr:hypothetical protein [Candidatus Liberibacter solanacearum]KGB27530.1 hypothetical protein GS16_03495 [Candidatus Liberibacter solanacearum]KGB27983.1 hypothetical protein GS16_00325 [Candidatus Liberibacter solanacearum]